jgi:hypothetical protein
MGDNYGSYILDAQWGMAESRERYRRTHHWPIIQGISEIYCAGFATWEYFPNRSTTYVPSISAVAATPDGAAMIPNYSMLMWLWLGFVALALSVAIPAIMRLVGNWKRRFASASESVNAHIENRGLDPTLFPLLELQLLKLSREIRQYVRSLGPPPRLPPLVSNEIGSPIKNILSRSWKIRVPATIR